MNEETRPPPDEADLHAFVDGRLAHERRAAVEQRLACDPAAAERVRAWIAQRQALHALHADVLTAPVPPHLLQSAQQLHDSNNRFARWQRRGGVAASLFLAFAVGWASHMEWQVRTPGGGVQAGSRFAQQAVAAHAVFVPEVRHPVEVEAAQQQHLVQWLSRRLNRPLKLPVLAAAGYELVGGRLLAGDDGPRAQFMYQNVAGERITLYVGAVQGAALKGMDRTAFQYTSEGGVASFYWVDQGFGYAISGQLPRAGLLVLAESVYQQL